MSESVSREDASPCDLKVDFEMQGFWEGNQGKERRLSLGVREEGQKGTHRVGTVTSIVQDREACRSCTRENATGNIKADS
jgi:hypothetical protein